MLFSGTLLMTPELRRAFWAIRGIRVDSFLLSVRAFTAVELNF